MTTDEIATKLKRILELRKQIKAINTKRHEDEIALATQYKIDECNKARNTLVVDSQNQINPLASEIAALEDELGN